LNGTQDLIDQNPSLVGMDAGAYGDPELWEQDQRDTEEGEEKVGEKRKKRLNVVSFVRGEP